MEAVRQLVYRAQNKDLTAFEQLVLLYQRRVYALAQKLEGNPLDAQDLAQEAFIRAYRALDSFRGEADFGTWLHRITVNIYLNGKRKHKLSAVVSLDEMITTGEGQVQREIPCAEDDPERLVMSSQLSEFMQQALDRLPKEQKAVLVLREIEELSYEEIAAAMECSIGTVRSRLSRARDALRRQVLEIARTGGINVAGPDREHVQQGKEGRVRELR